MAHTVSLSNSLGTKTPHRKLEPSPITLATMFNTFVLFVMVLIKKASARQTKAYSVALAMWSGAVAVIISLPAKTKDRATIHTTMKIV